MPYRDPFKRSKQPIPAEQLLAQDTAAQVEATEQAVELAAETGTDLTRVKSSGARGRVTKRDVEEHLEQQQEGE